MDMVAGVVGVATGAYILIKMEYMIEIIPFAIGIVALLGAVVKVQNTLDIRHLGSDKWYVMLALAGILAVLGVLLVINPFEDIPIVEKLVGVALLIDGVGNLVGIFWIGHLAKHPEKAFAKKAVYRKAVYSVETISGEDYEDELPEEVPQEHGTEEDAPMPEENRSPAGIMEVSKVSVFRPVDRSKKREKQARKEKPADGEE